AVADGLACWWRFWHPSIAEVKGDVVVAIRAIEDEVAAFHLLRTNALALVVLIAGKVRQAQAHAGKGVDHQARAVEANLVVITEGVSHAALTNALPGAIGIAATPSIMNSNLGLRWGNTGFELLAA